MKKSEQVVKEAMLITNSVKDVLSKNLITAMKSGTIDVREADLPKIINVLSMSVDDAYQLAARTYQKSVARIIDEK